MRRLIIASLLVLSACQSAQAEETVADSGASESWYPSRYGPDDRLGALNNLSSEKTAAAARLVTTGKTYSLGMVTGRDTPAFGHRKYDVSILQVPEGTDTPLSENKATGNDDKVEDQGIRRPGGAGNSVQHSRDRGSSRARRRDH